MGVEDKLVIDLSTLPEGIREKVKDFLQSLGATNKENIPLPKKIPSQFANKPAYLNLYTVEFISDIYEGTRLETYSCYSVGKPIENPEILKQHHEFFYPHHEIISIEHSGSYERPNIGRAKLIYNSENKEWVEVD